MGRTLVIAEPGMTWDRDLDKAYRLIDAAKACDADVCKFQWTSSGKKLQERRQVDPKYVAIYERGVQYPREWLEKLKAHCDSVEIEFACTTYLIEDIAVVAPLVKRFKVSAYESKWTAFVKAHPADRPIVVSCNDPDTFKTDFENAYVETLWCVSKYPTRLEDLKLSNMKAPRHGMLFQRFDGLSDHTANTLTGAAAVAAGASIVEAHIRLEDTPQDNPDFRHSLRADWDTPPFREYVSNIRTVERML